MSGNVFKSHPARIRGAVRGWIGAFESHRPVKVSHRQASDDIVLTESEKLFHSVGRGGLQERASMVFRKDNKVDAFQRQISALRQQLGSGEEVDGESQPASEARTPVERVASSDSFQRPGGYGAGFSDAPTGAQGFGDFATAAPGSGERGSLVNAPDPELPADPVVDARTTVIAHDTIWKGDLDSQGTIHVHGRFEGAIRAGADVFIADDADVDANVSATNVVVAGLMKGSVRCLSRFEVLPTGRVSGDILAPTLVVHEGASLTGQFRMGAEETVETSPTPVVQRRAARGSA